MKRLWYAFKRILLNWFADIRFYNFGIILWGDSSYKIKGPQLRMILNSLKIGDMLLRRFDHYLGSVLIPGFWSHVAIYLGGDQVVHMLGGGITVEDILTFTRADHLMIRRHVSKSIAQNAVREGVMLLEYPIEYDYNFDPKDASRFSCVEFVSRCYGLPLTIRLPDELANLPEFQTIWSSINL